MDLGWHFPEDNADQWDGFNDSGIEQFRGSPLRHLARETIQNSLDAKKATPVRVKFQAIQVPTSSLPDIEDLKKIFGYCKKAAENESPKAEGFFKNALEELSKRKLMILQVSDFNTFGLKGPAKNGTPFYAFMKATGQSVKTMETATGSYGIGKFAPYAVSNLRTVFVSTLYQDDGNQFIQLTQGKSILMSHYENGVLKRGAGYWGVKNKCQPLEGISSKLPFNLQRVSTEGDFKKENTGTLLSILAFERYQNWKELLAVSVAENFFGAIINNELVVDIGDDQRLDKGNLKSFFKDDRIKKILESEKEEYERFSASGHYLDALASESDNVISFEEETENPVLGLCQVKILLGEGLPKKVCILRNGMLITDNLPGLKRFNDFKEFIAVVQCLSTKGNELLRNMEPPRHDDFEPDRLATREEKRTGKQALKSLSSWVRNMLKRHAKDPVSEITPIDELKEFFGEEGEEGEGKGIEEINPFGEIVIRARPVKSKNIGSKSFENENVAGGEGQEYDGGGGGTGRGGGDGLGGVGPGMGGTSGETQRKVIDLQNIRAVPVSSNRRKIAFTSKYSGVILLNLQEAGADVDYSLKIAGTDKGKIQDGKLILKVEKEERINVTIDLKQNFYGAIKVTAYEI